MRFKIQVAMMFSLIIAAVSTANLVCLDGRANSKSKPELLIVAPRGGPGPACLPDGTGCDGT